MPERNKRSQVKPGNHGGFKHTAQPATLEAVLSAFGLKRKEYERTKAYVYKQVNKEPVHAH